MSRIIHCAKLQQKMEGLPSAPFPGELGSKIYNHISKQAWSMWLAHQTILINEYRLNLIEPKAQEFLLNEMQKFLFNDTLGSEK